MSKLSLAECTVLHLPDGTSVLVSEISLIKAADSCPSPIPGADDIPPRIIVRMKPDRSEAWRGHNFSSYVVVSPCESYAAAIVARDTLTEQWQAALAGSATQSKEIVWAQSSEE